jgi:hypothetical protein
MDWIAKEKWQKIQSTTTEEEQSLSKKKRGREASSCLASTSGIAEDCGKGVAVQGSS